MNAIPQTCRSHSNRYIRVYLEKIEEIKGIIRNRKWREKKIQYTCQQKEVKTTNNDRINAIDIVW
jgi:hypothetical protein